MLTYTLMEKLSKVTIPPRPSAELACEACGKNPHTTTVVDPDFSKDLSGQYEHIQVCEDCRKRILDELEDELACSI